MWWRRASEDGGNDEMKEMMTSKMLRIRWTKCGIEDDGDEEKEEWEKDAEEMRENDNKEMLEMDWRKNEEKDDEAEMEEDEKKMLEMN